MYTLVLRREVQSVPALQVVFCFPGALVTLIASRTQKSRVLQSKAAQGRVASATQTGMKFQALVRCFVGEFSWIVGHGV